MKNFLILLPILVLISPFLFPSAAFAISCASTRYWVGGTGTWDATDTTHWSETSGGAGGASVPTGLSNPMIFDASSGGGTVTLGYSPSVTCIVTMGNFTGTFDAATFSPTFGAFSGTGTGIRTLNMGSGTWILTNPSGGAGSNPWDITVSTNLTLNAQSSTIKMTEGSIINRTFAGGSQTYNNLWFARGLASGNNIVSGSNTFNDFKDTGTAAHNIIFTNGTTQTVSTFTVSGSSGNVITINSDTTDTHALVKTGGGTISSDYLDIQHSVATPASTWYAGTHSVDNQAVATAGSGWIFTDVPVTVATPSRTMRLFEGFKIKLVSGRFIIQQK
ncbi:MAG: hypothetical protein Q7S75_01715 [bacterium]|nr:hypothetical protein [bacterium]